jgi:hypothetical protein
MMKMIFLSTPRKTSPVPTIKPITIPIQPSRNINSEYPFSSMIDRIRPTGGCSSCGRK